MAVSGLLPQHNAAASSKHARTPIMLAASKRTLTLVSAIELAASKRTLTLVSAARVGRRGDLARMRDMKGEVVNG